MDTVPQPPAALAPVVGGVVDDDVYWAALRDADTDMVPRVPPPVEMPTAWVELPVEVEVVDETSSMWFLPTFRTGRHGARSRIRDLGDVDHDTEPIWAALWATGVTQVVTA